VRLGQRDRLLGLRRGRTGRDQIAAERAGVLDAIADDADLDAGGVAGQRDVARSQDRRSPGRSPVSRTAP
jgi:hypothetical protein